MNEVWCLSTQGTLYKGTKRKLIGQRVLVGRGREGEGLTLEVLPP